MRPWPLELSLEPVGDRPVFLTLARVISDAIASGRLPPGHRLPGSRTLARQLGINRNTVLAAFDELAGEGWLRTDAARGTFVADDIEHNLTRLRPVPHGIARVPAYTLRRQTERVRPPPARGVLMLTGGLPDLRLAPRAALGRAYRRAVLARSRDALDYAAPQGEPELREQLAAMLRGLRSIPAQPDDVLVCRGSQMALWLAFHALAGPGDLVAVEGFGYPPAWAAIADSGAELAAVPVDEWGIVVDRVEDLAKGGRLRAVYVTPHHQYPTLAQLRPSRRLELLELARKYHFAIVEDDYDNEFHYEGHPIAPLASRDQHGAVVYVGTLSKVLAPGLRVGYAVAPPPLISAMTARRERIDRQGDAVVERAVAELMAEGELQRHMWRMRREYQSRRDLLIDLLQRELGSVLQVDTPPGGMALWARVDASVDPVSWSERSLERGVLFHPGCRYAFDGAPQPFVRMGYTRLNASELVRAVGLVRRALPRRPARV